MAVFSVRTEVRTVKTLTVTPESHFFFDTMLPLGSVSQWPTSGAFKSPKVKIVPLKNGMFSLRAIGIKHWLAFPTGDTIHVPANTKIVLDGKEYTVKELFEAYYK